MSAVNLLDQKKQGFVLLDKRSHPDGFGGVYYTWEDGVGFEAALVKMSDTPAVVAEQEGHKAIFKLLFDKHLVLERNDRVKHVNTGQAYLITSNSEDMTTPVSSPLQLSQCTAERVTL